MLFPSRAFTIVSLTAFVGCSGAAHVGAGSSADARIIEAANAAYEKKPECLAPRNVAELDEQGHLRPYRISAEQLVYYADYRRLGLLSIVPARDPYNIAVASLHPTALGRSLVGEDGRSITPCFATMAFDKITGREKMGEINAQTCGELNSAITLFRKIRCEPQSGGTLSSTSSIRKSFARIRFMVPRLSQTNPRRKRVHQRSLCTTIRPTAARSKGTVRLAALRSRSTI